MADGTEMVLVTACEPEGDTGVSAQDDQAMVDDEPSSNVNDGAKVDNPGESGASIDTEPDGEGSEVSTDAAGSNDAEMIQVKIEHTICRVSCARACVCAVCDGCAHPAPPQRW